jgi:hypothetical protein
MSSFGTGLLDNLGALYRSHGGPKSLLRSAYFWIAVALSVLAWRRVSDETWFAVAQSILPTLAGFSIASFAILFAILDSRARQALRAPSAELGGRSPLLVLASSVTHAVVVQVCALLFSIIFASKPFPRLEGLETTATVVTLIASGFGLLLLLYAVVLVLATVLTVFKILEIAT